MRRALLAAAFLTAPWLTAKVHGAEIPLTELRELGPLAGAAADYLAAFNADDPKALERFLVGYRDEESLRRTPVEARLQRQRQFRQMLGPLSLSAVKRQEAVALDLIVHAETIGSFFELSFEASTLDPLKIGSMGMKPALPPSGPSDGTGPAASAQTLTELVEALLAEHQIPALAVASMRSADDVEVVVRGTRNIETGEPIEDSDAFHIGSITKSMTASIAARLVDRGIVEWSLRVGESLGELEMDSAYRDVTLRQLLQHRCGIEPLLDVDEQRELQWRQAGNGPRSQRLALAREVLAQAPAFEPGSSFSYSNAGYVVAALLLERAADKDWEALVAQEVFRPLGLNGSGLGWPVSAAKPQGPRGHWFDGETHSVQPLSGYSLGGPLAPAGDVHCPITELARYGWAHLRALKADESWITQASARVLHEPPAGAPTPYAMGWMIDEIDGVAYHLHAGSAETFFALLALAPNENHVVAVAMNDGDLSNDAVAREIVRQVWRLHTGRAGNEERP